MNKDTTPLVFAHIGDLHLTDAAQPNYADFLAIVAQLATECGKDLDFVLLPGDNADNGRPEQYTLVRTALRMLEVPVYILGGDHDMEQGSLDHQYEMPQASHLPMSKLIKGYCCIFLDVCGPGKGGPDFRLGKEQLQWLEQHLETARKDDRPILLFMHTYPDDLKDPDEKSLLLQWIREYHVLLVDMGHTHYNEIANDGVTLYTATRSTGQIEEGPVGYSLITVDQNIVGWRFKTLAEPFPFVLITHPADHRLRTIVQPATKDPTDVRAVVLGAQPITGVSLAIGHSEGTPMHYATDTGCFTASPPITGSMETPITVTATDRRGRPGIHRIILSPDNAVVMAKPVTGSDRYAIGPWLENGIFGTQLGPNRNAKPLKHK